MRNETITNETMTNKTMRDKTLKIETVHEKLKTRPWETDIMGTRVRETEAKN